MNSGFLGERARSPWRGVALVAASLVLSACDAPGQNLALVSTSVAAAEPASGEEFLADGRLSQTKLLGQVANTLDEGWVEENVFVYPGAPDLAIRAWRTRHTGPALWLIAGVHGEEPAGPNAIARQLAVIRKLAASGVPMVVIPLANPRGYRQGWRYPNTADRDWRSGGYSVGDSEALLPDLSNDQVARATNAPGPETRAFTRYVLATTKAYPPRLVLDLHEDEQSTEGGYIYSQGEHADGNPVSDEVVRLLQSSGIPLRLSGKTRFGEPIVKGVISRDDQGAPIRDGSIDELLAAPRVVVDGVVSAGPSGRTVIVVETPAFAGSRFEQRVSAQAAVVSKLARLWKLQG